MKRRLALVLGLVFALLVPASAAFARDIYVGQSGCPNGRLTTISNSNGFTGDTNVIVCDPT